MADRFAGEEPLTEWWHGRLARAARTGSGARPTVRSVHSVRDSKSPRQNGGTGVPPSDSLILIGVLKVLGREGDDLEWAQQDRGALSGLIMPEVNRRNRSFKEVSRLDIADGKLPC